jgi:hypothetical protein
MWMIWIKVVSGYPFSDCRDCTNLVDRKLIAHYYSVGGATRAEDCESARELNCNDGYAFRAGSSLRHTRRKR